MADLILETPEGVRLRRELAGAGARGAAALLDVILYGVTFLLLLFGLSALAEIDPTGATGFVAGLAVGGGLLGFICYHALFLSLWDGRTPGKRALGLSVVDEQGLAVTELQIMLRSMLLPIEMITFPLSIGLMLIAVGERRQRLGDLVAGTLVLRDPVPSEALEPFPRDTWEKHPNKRLSLSPAVVAPLGEAERMHIREVLARRELPLAIRDRILVRTARHALFKIGAPVPDPLDARTAKLLLRELYLYLRSA